MAELIFKEKGLGANPFGGTALFDSGVFYTNDPEALESDTINEELNFAWDGRIAFVPKPHAETFKKIVVEKFRNNPDFFTGDQCYWEDE